MSKQVVSDFLWLVVANVTRAAGQFAILLILTATSGFAASGQYAYALAVTAPTFMLLELGLRNIYVSSPESGAYRPYVFIRGAGVGVALGISCLIAQLQDIAPSSLVVAVATVKAIDSFVDILFAFAQKWGAVPIIGASMITATATSLAIVATLVSSGAPIATGILAAGLVSGCISGAWLRMAWPNINRSAAAWGGASHFTIEDYTRTLRRGAFLGAAVFSGSLLTSLPVLLVGRYHSDAIVGVVAPLLYAITAGALVSNAAAQALLPRLAAAYRGAGVVALRKITLGWLLRAAVVANAAILPLAAVIIWADMDRLKFFDRIPDTALGLVAATLALQAVPAIMGAASLVLRIFARQFLTNMLALVVAGAAGLLLVPGSAVTGACTVVFVGMATRAALASYQFLRWSPT